MLREDSASWGRSGSGSSFTWLNSKHPWRISLFSICRPEECCSGSGAADGKAPDDGSELCPSCGTSTLSETCELEGSDGSPVVELLGDDFCEGGLLFPIETRVVSPMVPPAPPSSSSQLSMAAGVHPVPLSRRIVSFRLSPFSLALLLRMIYSVANLRRKTITTKVRRPAHNTTTMLVLALS